MRFILNSNDQFGPHGPQRGAVGIVLRGVEIPDSDEEHRIYWTNFEGFEGDFILYDYMIDFV